MKGGSEKKQDTAKSYEPEHLEHDITNTVYFVYHALLFAQTHPRLFINYLNDHKLKTKQNETVSNSSNS